MSSPPRPPTVGIRSPPLPEAPKESAVSRLFIAPITFLSFLLSLALIDTHNHALRTASHSPPHPPTLFSQVKEFFHSIIFTSINRNQSPYAYVKSPDSQLGDGKGVVGKDGEKEPWHWHTKQRKMMRAEVEDAFRVRKWVVGLLLFGGAMGAVGAVGVVRWVGFMWRNWGQIGRTMEFRGEF